MFLPLGLLQIRSFVSPGICLDRLKFQTLPALVRKSYYKSTQLTEPKQRPTILLRPCPEWCLPDVRDPITERTPD